MEKPANEPVAEPVEADVPEVAETPVEVAPAVTEPAEAPVPEADELRDPAPDAEALSEAPARPHQGLVDQLHIRWHELKDFVRTLEGDVEDELGEVLALARKHL